MTAQDGLKAASIAYAMNIADLKDKPRSPLPWRPIAQWYAKGQPCALPIRGGKHGAFA